MRQWNMTHADWFATAAWIVKLFEEKADIHFHTAEQFRSIIRDSGAPYEAASRITEMAYGPNSLDGIPEADKEERRLTRRLRKVQREPRVYPAFV